MSENKGNPVLEHVIGNNSIYDVKLKKEVLESLN